MSSILTKQYDCKDLFAALPVNLLLRSENNFRKKGSCSQHHVSATAELASRQSARGFCAIVSAFHMISTTSISDMLQFRVIKDDLEYFLPRSCHIISPRLDSSGEYFLMGFLG